MAFNLLPAHAGHRSHVARRNACCHFVYFSNEFEDDEHSEANVDAGQWDWHWEPGCGCPAPWHVSCLCKLLTLARQPTGELRPADWKASSLTQLASGGALSPSFYPCYPSLLSLKIDFACLLLKIVRYCSCSCCHFDLLPNSLRRHCLMPEIDFILHIANNLFLSRSRSLSRSFSTSLSFILL